MNNELKPCPFCGGELELVESIVTETTAEPASAICPICRFRYVTDLILENTGRYSESGFDEVSMRNSDQALIQAVNRRPIESSLIEKLNEQRRYTGEAVKENERLSARIAELEEALLQAKVAMDYLGDILNNNDVVDAEQNDSAALNPLFVAVDNAINGISNGRERRNEIEAAASERTKQPLDE